MLRRASIRVFLLAFEDTFDTTFHYIKKAQGLNHTTRIYVFSDSAKYFLGSLEENVYVPFFFV